MVQMGAITRLQPVVLQRMSVDQAVDFITGDLAYRLSGYVLADQLASCDHVVTLYVDRSEFESWWQHTKLLLFPTFSRWLRRPPRRREWTDTYRKTVNVRNYCTFPEYNRVLPDDFGRHFRVQMLDESPWATEDERP